MDTISWARKTVDNAARTVKKKMNNAINTKTVKEKMNNAFNIYEAIKKKMKNTLRRQLEHIDQRQTRASASKRGTCVSTQNLAS